MLDRVLDTPFDELSLEYDSIIEKVLTMDVFKGLFDTYLNTCDTMESYPRK